MAREYTNKLIEMMEEGLISPSYLARDLMCYMSEDDVKDFAISEEYIEEEIEE